MPLTSPESDQPVELPPAPGGEGWPRPLGVDLGDEGGAADVGGAQGGAVHRQGVHPAWEGFEEILRKRTFFQIHLLAFLGAIAVRGSLKRRHFRAIEQDHPNCGTALRRQFCVNACLTEVTLNNWRFFFALVAVLCKKDRQSVDRTGNWKSHRSIVLVPALHKYSSFSLYEEVLAL